jgi:hypothetical protein
VRDHFVERVIDNLAIGGEQRRNPRHLDGRDALTIGEDGLRVRVA